MLISHLLRSVYWGSKLWQVRLCSADAIPQLDLWLSVHANFDEVVSRKQTRPLPCYDLHVFEPYWTTRGESALLGPNLLSGVSLNFFEAIWLEGRRTCKHGVLRHKSRLPSTAKWWIFSLFCGAFPGHSVLQYLGMVTRITSMTLLQQYRNRVMTLFFCWC